MGVELLDVVDDQDRVISRARRDGIHARGLKHRAVRAFVFNERCELFVQKRTAGKDTFPCCYDSSASGHPDSGEDYEDCAVRELLEELGLEISPNQLRKRFTIEASQDTGWEFVWVYGVRGDFRPTVNHAEIAEGAFWDVDAVRHLIADQLEQCAQSFCRAFAVFESRGLLPAGTEDR